MGIQFKNVDLKKDEFVELDDRNRRKNRVKHENEAEKKANLLVRKPQKVKPGYKKKMQWEMDKIKKRAKKNKFRKRNKREGRGMGC